MAERIELPGQLQGRPEDQLQQLYSYLYRMAQTMNSNLSEIGPAGLTDDEQQLMNQLSDSIRTNRPEQAIGNQREAETLKSLIIKTAEFVKTQLDAYKIALFGESEVNSEIGNYRLKQGLRVDVNPEGIKQTYSFAEIIKGLKTYEINAKNYIKTGLLRTENSIPIYGVAIGKDVVTFSEDGEETYNDSNKVAELTADALSFFSNGVMLAKYAGNRIGFYNGGNEVMYITNGKIYAANDLEIGAGKKIRAGNWILDSMGLTLVDSDEDVRFQINDDAEYSRHNSHVGIEYAGGTILNIYGYDKDINDFVMFPMTLDADANWVSVGDEANNIITEYSGTKINPAPNNSNIDRNIGNFNARWDNGFINHIYYSVLTQDSSREIKHDIRDMPEMGERLDELRPVTYVYDGDPQEQKRYGLIYEDTEDIMPEICTGDEGQKAINYMELVPMLLKEIQSLRARVQALEGGN